MLESSIFRLESTGKRMTLDVELHRNDLKCFSYINICQHVLHSM